MKTAVVCERLIEPASLRSAWDMRRACNPMWTSPISPSISARGTSAATESITTTSSAGADQHVRDLECLLPCVRLRDEQLIDIDTQC